MFEKSREIMNASRIRQRTKRAFSHVEIRSANSSIHASLHQLYNRLNEEMVPEDSLDADAMNSAVHDVQNHIVYFAGLTPSADLNELRQKFELWYKASGMVEESGFLPDERLGASIRNDLARMVSRSHSVNVCSHPNVKTPNR